MKTIRQIADELGVSKQAVQQRLRKEPLTSACRQHTTRNGNTIYIENQGVELIKASFSTSVADKLSATNDKQLVDFFKEQLREKDRQLAEKDRQLADITAALVAAQQTAAAAQALHAGTIQQQLASPGGEAPADERDVASPKRGIFGIFGRIKKESHELLSIYRATFA
jgi:predicted transcriptional regulator